MSRVICVDLEAPKCQCGELARVIRGTQGIGHFCVVCEKALPICDEITFSFITALLYSINYYGDTSKVTDVLETLRASDYPTRGESCPTFFDCSVHDLGMFGYGFPISRYFEVGDEGSYNLLRAVGGIPIPFIETMEYASARGKRRRKMISYRSLWQTSGVQTDGVWWAHIEIYSNVLNRLRVNKEGVLY